MTKSLILCSRIRIQSGDIVLQFQSQPSRRQKQGVSSGVSSDSRQHQRRVRARSVASKAGLTRAVNQWHSGTDHQSRSQVWPMCPSRSPRQCMKPKIRILMNRFCEAMRIPCEFSGDKKHQSQLGQMKVSIESGLQKSERRASSAFDGSIPIRKSEPPSRSKSRSTKMSSWSTRSSTESARGEKMWASSTWEAPTTPSGARWLTLLPSL
jgi:hypothetical protein